VPRKIWQPWFCYSFIIMHCHCMYAYLYVLHMGKLITNKLLFDQELRPVPLSESADQSQRNRVTQLQVNQRPSWPPCFLDYGTVSTTLVKLLGTVCTGLGVRGPFLTWLAPRGELGPQGKCLPLCSPPWVNILYCLEEWRSKQRISPPSGNFTPRGQTSPLEVRVCR
jgi:hypothetical protein